MCWNAGCTPAPQYIERLANIGHHGRTLPASVAGPAVESERNSPTAISADGVQQHCSKVSGASWRNGLRTLDVYGRAAGLMILRGGNDDDSVC